MTNVSQKPKVTPSPENDSYAGDQDAEEHQHFSKFLHDPHAMPDPANGQ
jgi:hypothetical protein